ncbi:MULTISPECIES: hypothetical protein [Synechocystis]|uniref:Uncharacterized protein n=1 Tax=Synechocystis salina LEGE 00031 TaxID=1828736 RepID=A0ABR9VVC5_9SYNC|nr:MULTISPECIES: hypothetical protein [Synechocystis]MBE9194270.1 hypothetical protein [Synechocystis sp. LEGE 06083]MBE9242084.1 hypothetical protein [Synechocystis salina LEGE 00041]MBE9255298.1 hypothetical protein [Synechocystis salina LEGE 00031]
MNQLKVSPQTWQKLKSFANHLNLSVTQLPEKIIQGELAIIDAEELGDLIDVQDTINAENDPENQQPIEWEVIKQVLNL